MGVWMCAMDVFGVYVCGVCVWGVCEMDNGVCKRTREDMVWM